MANGIVVMSITRKQAYNGNVILSSRLSQVILDMGTPGLGEVEIGDTVALYTCTQEVFPQGGNMSMVRTYPNFIRVEKISGGIALYTALNSFLQQ